MNTLKTLLKREYWEHRAAFRTTPLITGIIILVLTIILYLLSFKFEVNYNSDGLLEYGIAKFSEIPSEIVKLFTDSIMLSIASLYHFILYIVVFFFLLGSLYDDRKDNSILFWKSLPVSDLQTVLSKLITAIIIVPLLFTAALIVTHIALFILFSLIILIYGQNPFTSLLTHTHFLSNWWAFLVGCFTQIVWALPVYGWLMLCSSWFKRRPFLWAVLIPILIAFLWGTLNMFIDFSYKEYGVMRNIGYHAIKALAPFGVISEDMFVTYEKGISAQLLIDKMLSSIYQVRHIYGIIIAFIFISFAIYIRRYRNTT